LLTYYLLFNTRRPPLDDLRVRCALALATDRARLADVQLHGLLAPVGGGFMPSGMPGHAPGTASPPDIEAAHRLLSEVDYGRLPLLDIFMRQGHAHLVRPSVAQC
jgi:oligopeptide transport system substrate-binding protein